MTAGPPLDVGGGLLLVGAGKMGGAMLTGWLGLGLAPAAVAVLDPHPAGRDASPSSARPASPSTRTSPASPRPPSCSSRSSRR